jgi:signal transduction histidine kinase/predicted metal-dependent phosphoesterase TrpH
MTQWLLTDLHIHTTLSDGILPIEEVAKIYGEAGFGAIAITDHLFDTQSPRSLELYDEGKSIRDQEGYFHKIEQVSHWARETYDLLVIPGLEICNLLEDYHILGVDLKEPVNPNQDAEAVIKEIHRQGGLAIASHPPLKLSYFLNGDKESIRRHPLHLWKHRERYVDKIDAWEIANREDLFPVVSLEHLPFVANSDFHERHHLASWKSLIHAEKEKEAIKQAILQRKLSLFFFNENGSKGKRAQAKVLHEEIEQTEQKGKKGSKAKVLIVDDEEDLVAMLAHNFGKKGYPISTAYNGFEAWEKIQLERPDVLILDLMMPDLDGWELCRLVRRNQTKEINDIGILMLTARAMPEDRVYGLEIGADDYLTKPFSLNELLLRIEKLAGKRKSAYQLKEEMESLRSSIHRKETDLKRVVHDLRNPLLSIGASAKRMLRRSRNEEELKILGMIYDSSVRLTGWVDGTLSSTKLEAEMKEVDIRQLIQQVVNLLKETSEEKKIEMCFDSSVPIPNLFCHEELMFRTIENLLSNALKYSQQRGKVDITITPYLQWKEGGFVEISIKDTGTGISGDETERIFEPFYRGRNNSGQIGVGLGLSFAKQAVEFHGGRILVQSEPQKGSIFSILLPVRSRIELSKGMDN